MDKDLLKEKSIDKSMFEFAQMGESLHDAKFDTKPVGFFKDAMRRFAKNKGSVFAAGIILILVLFAIIAPLASPYTLADRDDKYVTKPPLVNGLINSGFWDGGQNKENIPEAMYNYYRGIALETGYDPIISVKNVRYETNPDGSVSKYYDLRLNQYYVVGVINDKSLTLKEYEEVIEYQNRTGIQILYPLIDNTTLVYGGTKEDGKSKETSALGGNYWYVINKKGQPRLNKNGDFVNVYKMRTGSSLFVDYDSIRIAGDPYDPETGNRGYAYAQSNDTGVKVRICYWNYYTFKNGHEPNYAFGTDVFGRDLLNALAIAARFSLILAVCVAAINMFIGTIYGAIEGYYGGKIDMTLERISDILSRVPFIIVVTLFNLHVAKDVGVVPAFLLAFVATGWIGMASTVRFQFYRFKGQEYVLAARTLGASDKRIMFRHVFPNSLGTIVTSCALVIPQVIGSETNLTYLGIINLSGDKLTSIGTLMQYGQANMTNAPHTLLFPALFLALLMLSFNLFGNGLRDAFNTSLRGSEG